MAFNKEKQDKYAKQMRAEFKEYTLEDLNKLSLIELLNLMPQNKCIDEYSEIFGYSITKSLVSFSIHKVIDGSWNLYMREEHNNKALKDQYVLFDFRCWDLRVGLIDMYLCIQQFDIEYMNGVESGRIILNLSNWEADK